MDDLESLVAAIRNCRVCEDALPLGPRPMVRAASSATILIIGQAPGTRVHESGVPWNDASGDRLRDWMGVSRDVFYDQQKIAIMPMGFCYPGRDRGGGDSPPRPECAPLWHDRLLGVLPEIQLTLLVGGYAQKRYLAQDRYQTMTETVRHWRTYTPRFLPLPHPSWRNTAWLSKNAWFTAEVLPELRRRVARALR